MTIKSNLRNASAFVSLCIASAGNNLADNNLASQTRLPDGLGAVPHVRDRRYIAQGKRLLQSHAIPSDNNAPRSPYLSAIHRDINT